MLNRLTALLCISSIHHLERMASETLPQTEGITRSRPWKPNALSSPFYWALIPALLTLDVAPVGNWDSIVHFPETVENHCPALHPPLNSTVEPLSVSSRNSTSNLYVSLRSSAHQRSISSVWWNQAEISCEGLQTEYTPKAEMMFVAAIILCLRPGAGAS